MDSVAAVGRDGMLTSLRRPCEKVMESLSLGAARTVAGVTMLKRLELATEMLSEASGVMGEEGEDGEGGAASTPQLQRSSRRPSSPRLWRSTPSACPPRGVVPSS